MDFERYYGLRPSAHCWSWPWLEFVFGIDGKSRESWLIVRLSVTIELPCIERAMCPAVSWMLQTA